MAVRTSSAGAGFPAIYVKYYRRMKANRVYPVTVSWADRPKPLGSIKHITVRLLGAGAQMVPSEQALDATRPDLTATFFVTPLAQGWLRAQRIEVLIQGRKVQEIPLATKVVSYCPFFFWLAMAVVLPLFLIGTRGSDPQWVAEGIQTHVPEVPAVIANPVPFVATCWNAAWEFVGTAYAKFWQFNQDKMLVFPVTIGCLLLALLVAFRNRDRRSSRTSKPLSIPAGTGEE